MKLERERFAVWCHLRPGSHLCGNEAAAAAVAQRQVVCWKNKERILARWTGVKNHCRGAELKVCRACREKETGAEREASCEQHRSLLLLNELF